MVILLPLQAGGGYFEGRMENNRLLPIAVGLIIMFLVISPLMADENRWSTNGPYGARVSDIAIHPIDNQHIYIGTIESGIYQTTDGGADWFLMEDDTLNPVISAIKIHPLGPDTIFAATRNGVFKSNDSGQSWRRLLIPGGQESEYRNLALNPRNPAIMLAGTWTAMYKSIDGGENWYYIYVYTSVQDIEFDPLDSNRAYYVSEAAANGNSIFRSDDQGETWINIHNDLDSIGMVQDMAIDPIDPQIIYLAEHVPLYETAERCLSKTTDGGGHWFDITPPGLMTNTINTVTISPFDHNTIYACNIGDGVLRSRDGGGTWQRTNDGLTGRMNQRVVIDSTTAIIYLGTFFDGIYRSFDEGDTWEKISYNIPHSSCYDIALNSRFPDSIFIVAQNGLFESDDGANSWQYIDMNLPLAVGGVSAIALDELNSDYVYAGFCSFFDSDNGGVARSTDGGRSWSFFYDGLPADFCARNIVIAYGPEQQRRVLAPTGAGLYYSDDLGESWELYTQIPPPYYGYTAIDVSPADNDIIYVARYTDIRENIFFKSTDRGETWQALENLPPGQLAGQIACDPSDPDIVYADMGLRVGLYKSTDGGESWFEINNNIPRDEFFLLSGIEINPMNTDNIYVNSFHNGVFVSHNGGDSWEAFNEGLRTGYGVGFIKIDPLDTTRLFMATNEYSVWSITNTLTRIDDNTPIPAQFVVLSNYPNPFNAATSISYFIQNSEHITLSIYNLLGQHVETIVDDKQQPGKHSITWDASDHPSGLYFARLKTAESEQNIKMVLLK